MKNTVDSRLQFVDTQNSSKGAFKDDLAYLCGWLNRGASNIGVTSRIFDDCYRNARSLEFSTTLQKSLGFGSRGKFPRILVSHSWLRLPFGRHWNRVY